MAEEKHEPPADQEVQEILGDLDAILSDIGGGPGPAVPGGQPPSAPAAPASKPPAAVVPPPAAPPKPAPVLTPPAAALPPAAPAPKPPAPVAAPAAPKEPVIELGARSLPPTKPPEKKPAPPPAQPAAGKPPIEIDFGGLKPALASPPAVPPAAPPKPAPVLTPPPAPKPPTSTAAPAPAAPPARPAQKGTPPPDALPAITPPDKITKEQVRRVAFIYLVKYEAERDALAKLLEQTAQTVPKKPLFMRRVLYQPVTEESGSAELLPRVQGTKAVVVIGIVEGVSEPRLRDWTEAFSSAGIKFWAVPPLEAGKKSVSIDIVVDAMLLPCEAA